MSKDEWSGRRVITARARWATRLPLPCWHCHRAVDGSTPWVVEHDPPRWMLRRAGQQVTPASEVGVSHRTCSDASGGRAAAAATNRTRAAARRLEQRPLRW